MMKKNPQHPFLNIVNIRTTEQKNIHSKVGGLNFYSKMANNNNNDDNKNMKCKKKWRHSLQFGQFVYVQKEENWLKWLPNMLSFLFFFQFFLFSRFNLLYSTVYVCCGTNVQIQHTITTTTTTTAAIQHFYSSHKWIPKMRSTLIYSFILYSNFNSTIKLSFDVVAFSSSFTNKKKIKKNDSSR